MQLSLLGSNAAFSRVVCGGGLCATMGAQRACTQTDTAYHVGCKALLEYPTFPLPLLSQTRARAHSRLAQLLIVPHTRRKQTPQSFKYQHSLANFAQTYEAMNVLGFMIATTRI